ncbi:MAG: PIN domain-containing protein [Gammaproteobacteria bacterium]|nr:PIN domain-containing protein [Gammaproteobacteria bacterium]
MKGNYFLDTNIFIYSFDAKFPKKQSKAQQLINDGLNSEKGMVSSQVIQEFLNVATKKFIKPLSMVDAELYLSSVLLPLCKFYPDCEFFHKTLRIKSRFKFSFYDSLILTAAIESNCSLLYSEDFQDSQKIMNLTIKNPFL